MFHFNDMGAGNKLKSLAQMATFPWRLQSRTAKGLPPPAFNALEVSLLSHHFQKCAERCPLDQPAFLHLLHTSFGLADDIMLERVFRVLDRDKDEGVTLSKWLEGMATILRGDLLKKASLCFQVYDLNHDGYITTEDLQILLKDSYHQASNAVEAEDMVSDLIEIAMKIMDVDRDGKLSLEDYQKSVEKEPLLLEAFGHCLPDPEEVEHFMSKTINSQDLG